jgi:serine/threonine protein kinase
MENVDLYELLGVSKRADTDIIRAAFGVLMKRCHPDIHPEKRELGLAISNAYSILSNDEKRAEYDYNRTHVSGTVIGDYRVLEAIAEGGFGQTYKGEHIRLKKTVCIKHCSRISPQSEEILTMEAQAMWDLRHYAIPAIHGLEKLDDGSNALVMSYMPGPNLEKVIEIVGRLPAEDVAWITERILNALKYIHYHGVIHGDMKPGNVIIQHETHQVSVVDFGLSKVKPRAGDGSIGFTPYFAPPEEENGLVLLPESDLYSLGMTMIYALSGDIRRVKNKEIPQDTPQPLCDFIKRLIVRDVRSRPHWGKTDLCDEIQNVRKQSFGRISSGMNLISGL